MNRLFAGLAIIVVGLSMTMLWLGLNDTCTAETRTTNPDTGESVIVNQTFDGSIAPLMCATKDTPTLVMSIAGPLLLTFGLWFTLKVAVGAGS